MDPEVDLIWRYSCLLGIFWPQVFNHGNHRRAFTYIDDIVEGVIRTLNKVATPNPEWSSDDPDPGTSASPCRLDNIGNNNPVMLMDYIDILEQCLGKKTSKNMLPLQLGDVPETYAEVSDLVKDVGYKPNTKIAEGIAAFVGWYRGYYK